MPWGLDKRLMFLKQRGFLLHHTTSGSIAFSSAVFTKNGSALKNSLFCPYSRYQRVHSLLLTHQSFHPSPNRVFSHFFCFTVRGSKVFKLDNVQALFYFYVFFFQRQSIRIDICCTTLFKLLVQYFVNVIKLTFSLPLQIALNFLIFFAGRCLILYDNCSCRFTDVKHFCKLPTALLSFFVGIKEFYLSFQRQSLFGQRTCGLSLKGGFGGFGGCDRLNGLGDSTDSLDSTGSADLADSVDSTDSLGYL